MSEYLDMSLAYEEKNHVVGYRGPYKTAFNAYGGYYTGRELELYDVRDCAKISRRSCRDPWWRRRAPPDASAANVLKTFYNAIAAHLSEVDRKNFDTVVWNDNLGEKTLATLSVSVIFEKVCSFLSDDDRASFHQAVDPPWRPWFYYKPADWKLLCRTYRFDETEIFRFHRQISWHDAVLDEDLLWRVRDVADWKDLSETRHFTTREMMLFKNYIWFNVLDYNQCLTRRQIDLLENTEPKLEISSRYDPKFFVKNRAPYLRSRFCFLFQF